MNKEINKETQELPQHKNLKDWFKTSLLGFIMGLAIIIPGISGGNVAIIFKLYDKILFSISNIIKRFKYCFLFLLPLIICGLVGFLCGFFGLKQLLDIAMFSIVCLFVGLMLGAAPSITDELKGIKFKKRYILYYLVPLLIPISFSTFSIFLNIDSSSLFQTMPWWLYLVAIPLGIVIAITQILPGLSATAILMTIGFFKPIFDSISLTYWKENPLIFIFYGVLIIGFLIGLFFGSKILLYILNKFKHSTYVVICGFMTGSIITMFYNKEMVDTVFSKWTTSSNITLDLCIGLPLLILGFIIAYYLVRLQRKKENK